ncbi:MAG TPA: LLM class F420-dependent oxidoreductase [Actinomycetota bacterium]|nr:LLM class F420-dependent oxidoreductase [Actinomycetota bacterium]
MANTRLTRLGLQIPSFTFPGVPDDELFERVASVAVAAESSGFDSLWVMDHFYQIWSIGRSEEPMLEGYALLSALAARTERARLGTMVTGVTYRNPALLAKTVTTLDVISSGRAILGIGAAWNDEEHRGLGFEFPPVGERMDRLEEAVQICRLMFTEESPSFQGRHYRIEKALNFPRPVTAGGPPILIGGAGEKRTLRLVARYGDACNIFGDVETFRHKMHVLDRHCEDLGRDPAEISRTKLGTVVVAPTAAEADRLGAGLRAARNMDEERYRSTVLSGTPEQVAEQLVPFLESGLDGFIFNMHQPDAESVALAGSALAELLT